MDTYCEYCGRENPNEKHICGPGSHSESGLNALLESQLRAFLEGLEINNIDELLKQPPEYFKELGIQIGAACKTVRRFG